MLKSPLGQVPNDWTLVRLKDVTTKIGSGATPTGGGEAYLSERQNAVLVRSQNVFDRYFSSEGLAFITDEDAKRLDGVMLEEKDVLLNITGDGITFGRACLVPSDILPARVNQHVSIIRANRSRCEPGYLLSYLTHPLVKEYIESFNAGGSRRAITKAHIESFVLPLPPLETQRAIAHILGTLDDKIELNRRTNQTLEAMAKALFKSWFVDFDPVRAKAEGRQPEGMDAETAALFPDGFGEDGLPRGWRIAPLASVTSYLNRGISPSYLEEGGVCVINQKCVRDGRVDISKARRHNQAKRSIQGRELLVGDVLVNSTGVGTLGRVAQVLYLEEPTIVDSHVTVVRADPEQLNWVYLGINLRLQEPEIERLGEGSTGQTELSRVRLGQHLIVVPEPVVLTAFEKIVKPTLQLVSANELESRTLAALRDALLPKLLSGELSVSGAGQLVEART